MFKLCRIIGISKIEFFSFSGIEKVKLSFITTPIKRKKNPPPKKKKKKYGLILTINFVFNVEPTQRSQLTFTCSNSTIEIIEKGVKYVQS